MPVLPSRPPVEFGSPHGHAQHAVLGAHPRRGGEHPRHARAADDRHRRGRRQHRRPRPRRGASATAWCGTSPCSPSTRPTSSGSARRSRRSTGSTSATCPTARSSCTRAARSRSGRRSRSPTATTCRWPTRPASPGSATPSPRTRAEVHTLTIKKNTVAIVTDGTAVLGLGDIGPDAALPVMEGKALLFKEFAGIDAFPICLDVDDARRDRRDGRAARAGLRRHQPRGHRRARTASRSRSGCKASLDIPVFHDDQHGTAVVVLAALRNSLKVVDKKMEDLKVVIAGVGRGRRGHRQDPHAGRRAQRHRRRPQGRHLRGPRRPQRGQAVVRREHQPRDAHGARIHEVMPGADVFVGVSGPGLHHARRPAGHARRPDRVRPRQPRPRDHARGGRRARRGHRHRAQRLPEPDQQRAVLPRHLPRRARRRRHHASPRA